MGRERDDARRNAKDSASVKLFEDRANVFRLYRELHPEDPESSEAGVRIRTLKRVISRGYADDLGFSAGDRLICLAEAQSYPMDAMRLRTLSHLSATFQSYPSENGMTVYDVRRGTLPKWEAYVVYAGRGGAEVVRLGGIMEDMFDDSPSAEIAPESGGLLRDHISVCRIIDGMLAGRSERDREEFPKASEACRAAARRGSSSGPGGMGSWGCTSSCSTERRT